MYSYVYGKVFVTGLELIGHEQEKTEKGTSALNIAVKLT